MRLRIKSGDWSACPLQYHVEVIDAEEQEEPIARWRLMGTHQGGRLVSATLVEAEQDGSIRIEDLTKVVMARRRLGLTEESDWYHRARDWRPPPIRCRLSYSREIGETQCREML